MHYHGNIPDNLTLITDANPIYNVAQLFLISIIFILIFIKLLVLKTKTKNHSSKDHLNRLKKDLTKPINRIITALMSMAGLKMQTPIWSYLYASSTS